MVSFFGKDPPPPPPRPSLLLLVATVVLGFFSVQIESFGSSSSSMTTPPIENTLGADLLKQIVLDAAELDTQQTLDVKGIVWLEHVNLVVGDKALAQRFYIDLLGCTPDKSASFHVNMGQQQFHLAQAKDGEHVQVITGSIGLAVPSIATIQQRMETALQDEADLWKDTLLQVIPCSDNNDNNMLTVICPWGNRFHLYDCQLEAENLTPASNSPHKMVKLHDTGGTYDAKRMAVRGQPGIRYIEIKCRPGSTPAIAQFYQDTLACTVTGPQEGIACVCVGPGVHLVYTEEDQLSQADEDAMQGVHICIYVQDFEGLYARLSAQNVIWTNPRFTHLDSCDTWEEARASRTLRFKDIKDGQKKKVLELEHETRPMRHGQYMKVPFYEPR